ncbi:tRNA adenosine(34) deaminase TadA [Oscillatoria sp. FACHB-1406]|uniref:tRNA adenosine(34) deaminase TadA n=1 Tax=Oscillatoria sp. FACHB-1406 TaxID=2692846 RepID=UPI00321F87B3
MLEKNPIEETTYRIHQHWMQRALKLAQEAGESGEVPVGAVIVAPGGVMLAEAVNRKERDRDPTAHAEILALRAAAKAIDTWHLDGCTLYVTLEPCAMCAGAAIHARIGTIVYGADDSKTGAIRTVANLPDSLLSNHRLSVLAGIRENECRSQLQAWFAQRRTRKFMLE